jgi:DNA-binding response OmpR family regulator
VHPQSILLTDADDPTIEEAVAQLDAWRLVQRSGDELLHALESADGVRAVLTTTANPNALRDVSERAQARGIPLIVGCADETARRRAVELRADEWYRTPAPPDEIAGRIRTALARAPQRGAARAERVEVAEYEHIH